tara:strand:- start:622 stop:789 length:168 start_codon:yes stop_codon:yes gene_type:complete
MKNNKIFFIIVASSIIPSLLAWNAFSNGDYYSTAILSILSYGLIFVAEKYRRSEE